MPDRWRIAGGVILFHPAQCADQIADMRTYQSASDRTQWSSQWCRHCANRRTDQTSGGRARRRPFRTVLSTNGLVMIAAERITRMLAGRRNIEAADLIRRKTCFAQCLLRCAGR